MSVLFKYKAYSADGQVEQGEISAVNEQAAVQELKKQQKLVLKISEAKQASSSKRVTLNELEQSTSQLSTLLANGLKVDKALSVLARSNRSSAIGAVWASVLNDIKQGFVLSDAIAQRPHVFSTLYAEMVKIGESTGNLPRVFSRLSQNLQFQSELRKKVIQASTYPLFILIVCVVAIWAIFNFVVPSMSSMFEGTGDIPSYTQTLLAVSAWVQQYQWHMLIGLLLVGGGISLGMQKPAIRLRLFKTLTSLHLLKHIVKHSDRIKFSTALQLTLESGVSLSDSLSLAAHTVSHPVLKERLLAVVSKVSAGGVLSDELERLEMYDDVAISLISVGEESGTLAGSFAEIARRSRSNFEQWLTKFTALLEPLLILIMGGIVGSVVIIMLLSIVSMNDVSF
ncbi:secretion system protein [Pseudoalteromonas ruthenica]|uniref:Secretion system protein n=1 Tax=Pseudoalteromonas ruthenica TaxID=151081 RepID=A0A5S3Z3T0_9GAMM|nr:type II secretion system F family protein [Pseudoalteromonas ruthenica]TMP86475.1 secretion system protein [Pseudoalteromonas ruthenica]